MNNAEAIPPAFTRRAGKNKPRKNISSAKGVTVKARHARIMISSLPLAAASTAVPITWPVSHW